jgi:hypothetical protein
MSLNPSRILNKCPMCQAAYEKDEVRLVGGRGATRLFHCHCHACGHAMLAVILENGGWVSSVGLVTDLEATDAIRFQSSLGITADECVGWHRLLEEKSAELCEYLSVGIQGKRP